MPDDASPSGDPLHMNLKGDVAHVRREDVGEVMVFVVDNDNIYPKQAKEIAHAVKGGIRSADRPKVLLDLSRVQFICSALIGHLVYLHERAQAKSGDFKICVTGERPAYTMKLVHLNRVMDIGGDRQQLIESF